MINSLITVLQIFGIGLTMGIAGPCLLTCAPIILAYVAGSQKRWPEAIADVSVFLSGRLSAYVILGALAGLSGSILRQLAGSRIAPLFKIAAAIISILLGIFILLAKKHAPGVCKYSPKERRSLFLLGFVLGLAPCAPLMALLFEITLISKNIFDGAFYALSFGLGTFFSGIIMVGILSGVITGVAGKLLKSAVSAAVFRIACALLLILLGLTVFFTAIN